MSRFRKSTLVVTVVLLATVFAPASSMAAGPSDVAKTVASVEVLGEAVVPTGTGFAGTEIGGLSSITFDRARGVYYVLSDDQGNRDTGDPVRYYTVRLRVGDGTFDETDVRFVGVQELFDFGRSAFVPGGLDPEGFVLGRNGQFFMSSEGNTLADPVIDPFIRRYNKNGVVTGTLEIPEKFLPGTDQGVRFNLAFESLNFTPDMRTLVTASEGALVQDGPASSYDNGSYARIVTYDANKRDATAEYVYEVGPWAEPSDIFGVNGIVEVLPIDNAGTMLVMERSFSVGGILGGGTGNVVEINEVSTRDATDVSGMFSLYDDGSLADFEPVTQRQVFDFETLGIPIDNIEGMTFGPRLRDGRQTLVIVSDNNFAPTQFTQFILLALDVQPAA